ncbi:MAG: glycoside hydrolase family 47 protein, partial [Terriglobus roseus]|nr:glycoside hydrolase family 47 protein [Terriglobus roseus]
MNNRDPFNLRRPIGPSLSPLNAILAQGAARAADLSRSVAEKGHEAIAHTRHALEHTVAELQGAPPSQSASSPRDKARRSDDDMSFTVPRNVPDFQDPKRGGEDRAWGASGSGAGAAGTGAGGARSRLVGQVFGNGAEGKGLPMYKDKPYNYAPSGKRGAWWLKRRTWTLVGLAVIAWLWWNGLLFSGPGRPDEQAGTKPSEGKSKGTKKGGKVDWDERREAVRDAFKLSWAAYEEHAWGYDEYKPISKKGAQMVPPDGLGWIIVDSLDTLMLMNLTTELAHAREWIGRTLNYDVDHDVNTFETTIRMLGGLLSAHYLSTEFPDMAPQTLQSKGEDLYLEKATDLADRLLGAYDSPSGIPWASVNLKTLKGIQSHADGGASSTAEATTLQLEMKYLAKLTGETQYWQKAEKVMQAVDDNAARDGLVPIFIYAD